MILSYTMALYVNKPSGRDSSGKITYSGSERVNTDRGSTKARIVQLNIERTLAGEKQLKGTQGVTTTASSVVGGIQEAIDSKAPPRPVSSEQTISSPALNRPVTASEARQASLAIERSVAQERELVRSGVLPFEQSSGLTRQSLTRDAAVERELVRSGVIPSQRVSSPEPARGLILGTSERGRSNIARAGRFFERQASKEGVVQDVVFSGALGQEPGREQVRAVGQFLSKAETRPVRTITGAGLAAAFPLVTLGVAGASAAGTGVSSFLERGRSTTAFSPSALSRVREAGVESTQTRIGLPFTEKSLSVPFTEFLPGRRARFENVVGRSLREGGVSETEVPGLTQRLVRERRVVAGTEATIGLSAEVVGEARGRGLITSAAALGKAVFTGNQKQIQRQGFLFGAEKLFSAGASEATIAVAGSSSVRTGRSASFENLAVGGAVGGASASLVGGAIIGREVAGTSSRNLRIFSNVADPNEVLGDLGVSAGAAARRQAGGVTFDPVIIRERGSSRITVVPRSRPDVTLQSFGSRRSASSSPSSPVVSIVPTTTRSSSLASVSNIALTPSRASVFTPSNFISSRNTVGSPSRSFVPVSSRTNLPSITPVPSPSNSLSPVFSFSPAIVPTTARTTVATTVPTSVSTRVNVNTFTPPFPPIPLIPPQGGLGGGGGSGVRSRRNILGYAPSVAAVTFGITGKKTGNTFTGLELRPIVRGSSPRGLLRGIA